MTNTETVIIAGLQIVLLVGFLVLFLRRTPPDPALSQAMATLQSAQDRLSAQVVALSGEMKVEMAERFAAQSREISGFSVEQARLLNAGLAAQEKAVLDRLANDATAIAKVLAEQRAGATAAETKLQEMLTAANAETKQTLEAVKTTLAEGAVKQAESLAVETGRTRDLLDLRLKELREGNEQKLAEIQKSVNEQLQSAVEKQMNESFSRVIDQFTAVQKAMGDVQAVTGQIGDIKRLFSNVKTRGGWGETQVRLLLDDLLPAGGYETNIRLTEGSGEVVEFAVLMPVQGGERVYLAVDAKFPVEDYERLINAGEAGDIEAEKTARRGLQRRVRDEAAKIASKYIVPPRTVEFAVLYLPTDGLYAEVAREPGLIEEIGRLHKVLVLGPSILPALLRTIQLGYVTLTLNQKADMVRELLGATKTEMLKMEGVLDKLGKNVGALGNNIRAAQTRTRAVTRKLKGIDAIALDRVDQILEIAAEVEDEDPDEAETD